MTGFGWTIKRKLLALGAGTLLPLLGLLALWGWWELREGTARTEAELTLASYQGASQVETLLDHVTGDLRSLARNPAVQRRQGDRVGEFFREVIAGTPGIENLFALTADGRIVATAVSLPAGAPVTLEDRSWFKQIMATGALAVGGFEIGRIVGKPVAVVAIPMRVGDGPPTGALVAALSLQRLHTLFRNLPLAGRMTLTVVDGEGQVLSHVPEAAGWIGRRLGSHAALPPGPAVVKRLAWFEGEERIFGVTPVSGTPWRVLVGTPRSFLMVEAWKEVGVIGVPLLALLALSSLIGLLIARRVWRPIQGLREAARRLSEGEEQVSISVDSSDEVGDLARTFHAMAARIRASRSRLERQVAELTALNEAGRTLTSTLKLPEVLQRLTELIRIHLEVDVVRIWLERDVPGELSLQAQAGVTRQEINYHLPFGPGEGLVGWIMAHRAPLILPDVQDDPRLKNRAWFEAEGLVSFLGVPLLQAERPIGILAVMSRERRDFFLEEVALAQALASQAAAAIENARLVERLRQTLDELKAAQEQLIQGEALRGLAELASGAAHHLNNLLTVVLGRLQLVLPTVEAPALRRSLESIQRAARDGAEVVRRLQQFARMQRGETRDQVDLNEVAADVLELARPLWQDTAQARGVQIEAALEAGAIPPVLGQGAALREGVLNLVLNAIDAQSGAGRLTVRTWREGAWVCLAVEDTGGGMPEEVRRRALEPFFTTKGPKATGLGLSATYGIIQRHGGELRIDSVAGKGTTVTIRLPVAPEAAQVLGNSR